MTELSIALDHLSIILHPFKKINRLNFHSHWITSPSLTPLQEDQLTELSMLWINLSAPSFMSLHHH